ncbi:MAG: ubiquinol-cytochrome c reductase iron-sulfur subunit [Candidatus Eremiobacteraeota bacterium]|nr:ubiquinol-cytochrome c reductase iron-sulfur subunit [Candidatus Eremiobacteraeota bacterium]
MPEEATAKAYQDPGTPEEVSRRSFMGKVTIALGGLVGLGVAVPAVLSLIPTEKVLAGSKEWWPLNKAEIDRMRADTAKPIKIFFKRKVTDGYIEEENNDYVYGVALKPGEEQQLRAERPDLFAVKSGEVPYPVVTMGFVMFSPICPHLGCHYDWNDSAGKFICPCHGSVYTRLGKHIGGPAPRGLDPLPFREQSGIAEVTWVRFKTAEAARLIISYS